MVEFFKQDLSEARFEQVDFSRAWFRNVYFSGSTLRGAWLEDVEIDGEIRNVTINGVDIGPLIEAELDRRYPARTKLRPTDPAGYSEAWGIIESAWSETVEHARTLRPELLDRRVADEWSFIETLRHLVFAADAWIRRAILGIPDPFSPLGLHCDEGDPDPNLHLDPEAHPTLDEVLQARAERMAAVRQVIDGLTDEVLARPAEPVTGPGYPAAGTYSLQRCLGTILNEEWLHRLYAERDLAALEGP